MNRSFGSPSYPAITSASAVTPLETAGLFHGGYAEPELSPIDQYFENNKPLNVIASSSSLTHEAASIVLLGYMSAVESYLRAVIRAVIGVDEYAQKLVENMEVIYAAAVHHKGHLMPDALLEGTSLANPEKIKEAMRTYLGIKGPLPHDIQKVLEEFRKICELRHCCVHRFGKLGAKNAVRLGMSAHSKLLDKPLRLSSDNLQDISFLLRSLVNTINRFIFEALLDRLAKNKDDNGKPLYEDCWTWNYSKDRKRFLSYYSIFASRSDTMPSPEAKQIYDAYRIHNRVTRRTR